MHHDAQPDYGTGQKTLGVYTVGLVLCVILTLAAFAAVMIGQFTKLQTFFIIYSTAFIQFLVQLVCFLRLNTRTEQGQINVMAFVFTLMILLCVIFGSLWIMWNLNFYMVH